MTIRMVQNQFIARVLALVVALVVIVLITFSNLGRPPLLNNGDYGRTVRSTMRIPIMKELDWPCSKVANRDVNWRSVTSILYFFQVKTAYFFGVQCVGHLNMLWVQTAIYVLGAAVLILSSATPFRALLLVAIPLWLFGEYLGSFYEEGGVLAFMPLWLYAAMAINVNKWGWILYLVASCIILYGKSQNAALLPLIFIIFLGCFPKNVPGRKLILTCLVFVTSLVAFLSAGAHDQNKLPNSYNRLFNGIGWSMQRVDDWPVKDFLSRRAYFEEEIKGAQWQGDAYISSNLMGHMGTSFWPDGEALIRGLSVEQFNAFALNISAEEYVDVVSTPAVLGRLLVATYRVFLSSDYSVSYLRVGDGVGLGQKQILQNLGWISVILLLGYFVFHRGSRSLYALPLVFLLLPVAVVLGDGFYEFEKHMVAYFISLAFLGVVFLRARSS